MNPQQNIGFMLRAMIGIAYILLGVLMIFSKVNFFHVDGMAKMLFALLLIAYGSFRLYRAVKLKYEEH